MHSTQSSIAEHLPLVQRVAKRIARRLPRVVNIDDLVGAGTLGLIDAMKRCDPERADRFHNYAEFRIRGAILDELRQMDWLPRSQRARLRRSAQLGVAAGEERVDERRRVVDAVLLIDDVRDDGFEGFAVDTTAPAMSFEVKQQRQRLTDALAALSPRHQQILALYYVEELTLKQIGAMLGVTESRVCQIRADAVAHLRELLIDDVELC